MMRVILMVLSFVNFIICCVTRRILPMLPRLPPLPPPLTILQLFPRILAPHTIPPSPPAVSSPYHSGVYSAALALISAITEASGSERF